MSDTILSRLRAPQGVVDAVLDTDTFNEIDDQFALSYMLRSTERINTRAIYAAPFFNENSSSPEDGMLKSYEEIKTLLKLANREDLIPCAFEGSRRYLPDEKTPVDSPPRATSPPAPPSIRPSIRCTSWASARLPTSRRRCF